ncbi:MAG: hypothetical protein KDB26_08160 [Microthrixaceae bacterium]|nr:hypothetical protein [Microthrixaceae bacterium]
MTATRREPTLDEAVRILLWNAIFIAPDDYRSTDTATNEEGWKRGWWSVFPPGDLILDQVEDVVLAAQRILALFSNHHAVVPISDPRWKKFVGVTDAATALQMLLDRKLLKRDGDRVRVGIEWLVDKTSPAPATVPEPEPAYAAPAPATSPSGQSQERVTRPAAVTVSDPAYAAEVPAPAPAPIPATRPAGQSVEKVSRPVQVPAEPLDPLIVRAVRALELMAENQLPRPVEIIPKGDSAVVDTARELAVLLDALGPVTKNALRERVRARLRPFTVHALEYAVKCGAFQLVGSPLRGGEYTLIDPEPLGMSWALVKSMSARRKPARALAGARGT